MRSLLHGGYNHDSLYDDGVETMNGEIGTIIVIEGSVGSGGRKERGEMVCDYSLIKG